MSCLHTIVVIAPLYMLRSSNPFRNLTCAALACTRCAMPRLCGVSEHLPQSASKRALKSLVLTLTTQAQIDTRGQIWLKRSRSAPKLGKVQLDFPVFRGNSEISAF